MDKLISIDDSDLDLVSGGAEVKVSVGGTGIGVATYGEGLFKNLSTTVFGPLGSATVNLPVGDAVNGALHLVGSLLPKVSISR